MVCGLVSAEAGITLPAQVVEDIQLLKSVLSPATTHSDYKQAIDKLHQISSADDYMGVLRVVLDSAQWQTIQQASAQLESQMRSAT